ncbi:MAG: 23S rRNA (pseudouridine(1915)-N(3))-methyltransferase RlmH [Candidatus Nanoarchaeia archaeon]
MIRLIAIGRIRKKYIQEGIDEFLKRLRPLTKLEVVEVKDEKIVKDENRVREVEAEKVLRQIKEGFVVACDEKGKEMSSKEFSRVLKKETDITFIIGGTLGLSEKVKKRADKTISLSKMTFTHQMARLILLEQIYRAQMIIKNRPYHK